MVFGKLKSRRTWLSSLTGVWVMQSKEEGALEEGEEEGTDALDFSDEDGSEAEEVSGMFNPFLPGSFLLLLRASCAWQVVERLAGTGTGPGIIKEAGIRAHQLPSPGLQKSCQAFMLLDNAILLIYRNDLQCRTECHQVKCF